MSEPEKPEDREEDDEIERDDEEQLEKRHPAKLHGSVGPTEAKPIKDHFAKK